ncbi:MAG: carboxymuconolactone decarboxylase family protein [Pseudomonadota bacterium]
MQPRVALLTIEDSPPGMRGALEDLQTRFGELPLCVRAAANSPRALDGLLALSGSLGWGRIEEDLADRIAIAVAVVNDCTHLAEMHRCALRRNCDVSDDELALARDGHSINTRYDAALQFAVEVAAARGRVSDASFQLVRTAGFTDEEIIEIISHVALQTFGNYLDLSLLPPRENGDHASVKAAGG